MLDRLHRVTEESRAAYFAVDERERRATLPTTGSAHRHARPLQVVCEKKALSQQIMLAQYRGSDRMPIVS